MKTPWHTTPAAPFGGYVTKFLLYGPRPFDELPRDRAVRAEVLTFCRYAADIAAAWKRHEPWLRHEAERLAIAPRWPGRKFFGEAVAAGR